MRWGFYQLPKSGHRGIRGLGRINRYGHHSTQVFRGKVVMHFTRVLVGLYGFATIAAAQWSGDIFKSTGKPTGTEIEYDGGELQSRHQP
jgi:hypothetical protein